MGTRGRRSNPTPNSLPEIGEGGQNLTQNENQSSPPPQAGEGVFSPTWRTPPDLWEKLKPLARQMRREPTPAENALWQRLRKKQLGVKFRRQHAIDRFIVDFYCGEARLIVEVDGPIHDYTPNEGTVRQEYLERQGFRVIRFSNQDVLNKMEAVLKAIADTVTAPFPE